MNQLFKWFGSFLTAGHIRNENDGRSRRNEDIAESALAKAESAILLNQQLVQLISTGESKIMLEENQRLTQVNLTIKNRLDSRKEDLEFKIESGIDVGLFSQDQKEVLLILLESTPNEFNEYLENTIK